MWYSERSNISVNGVPKRKESEQKQYLKDTGRVFSKIDTKHQSRNSMSSANLKQDIYKETMSMSR